MAVIYYQAYICLGRTVDGYSQESVSEIDSGARPVWITGIAPEGLTKPLQFPAVLSLQDDRLQTEKSQKPLMRA